MFRELMINIIHNVVMYKWISIFLKKIPVHFFLITQERLFEILRITVSLLLILLKY